jgi:iron complex outermembrane receptor protein
VPWKGGITYRPFEGLLFRAARSLDIRAPNIFERNDPASSRNGAIVYGNTQPTVAAISVGNPNLVPEKANTTTYGFALAPLFAPGFAFSLDHWQIETKNLITTLAAQDVVDYCLAGQQSFCKLITYDNAGTATTVTTPFLNLALVDVSGFDAQASYRLPLDRINANFAGALNLNLAGTYTSHSRSNPGTLNAPTIDRAGENGPLNQFAVPRFISTSSVSYTNESFSALIQVRQVSGGKYDVTFTQADINNNQVSGRTYFDLSGTYNWNRNLSFFALINNLLNRDPPSAPTTNDSPTNTAYYDVLGRVIKVGVRYKM